jgi:hypothetical protein
MNTLQDLFATGRIVDLILVLVAVEAAALLSVRAVSSRGPSPAAIIANLAAGAMLMLALRSVLVAAHWSVTALWLVAALVAHLTDLALRWR